MDDNAVVCNCPLVRVHVFRVRRKPDLTKPKTKPSVNLGIKMRIYTRNMFEFVVVN